MKLGDRYSQHSFAQVPKANIPRSLMDRSFPFKDTVNFDEITPIFVDEVLPGDTINLSLKTFIRLATQQVPILDNMYVDFFFFFVPNRLVWDNWEKFMGAQDNPGDTTDYLVPKIAAPVGGFANMSLYDHYGITPQVASIAVNALIIRGYNLIWNEWFRDQNLQNSLTVPKGDGPDLHSLFTLKKKAKKHDYFTSALPWPQKGSAVSLPLGTTAPLVPTGTGVPTFSNVNETGYNKSLVFTGATFATNWSGGGAIGASGSAKWFNPALQADLSAATAATINQLRQAFMMQSLLEADARGGTRYVEMIKAHFNVVNPDFRLQRPEFLSGATININQHPVTQTSESGTTPQANLAAFSTASEFGNKIGFSKSFTEHGYVHGFMVARGEVTYQQGLNRMWSRQTRWDYFWPKFQELGEQTILNQEIYLQGTSADLQVFGYQERHADYRYRPGEIRGQFRSTFAQSLDVWHLAQEFSALPVLSSNFIQSSTPIERVLVVTDPDYPDLLVDGFFQYKHARPMVAYGVPATLGRF